ncbi:MAG: DUF2508 family protein [Oscillospiraceae bacterium]|nr:DUF2508 family protein [Oscillospiraceae bacterium]
MDAFAVKIGLKTPEETKDTSLENVKEEIRRTAEELENAQMRFDLLTDEKLIEAQIYEIRALKARYSYYFKKAKELSGI